MQLVIIVEDGCVQEVRLAADPGQDAEQFLKDTKLQCEVRTYGYEVEEGLAHGIYPDGAVKLDRDGAQYVSHAEPMKTERKGS